MRKEYDFSNAVRGKYSGKVIHKLLHASHDDKWHHPSVRLMAGDRDPVETIITKAREITLGAIDSGVISLPVDPFKLAELRSIAVVPRPDVRDARTVAGAGNAPIIQYNPNRPRTRLRFSICHELAHTLFPDCTERVRNRLFHSETSQTSQELEMLCNLAAAEFLLPIGSITEDIENLPLSIETAVDLRIKYEASVEAVLLRIAGLSSSPLAVFAAAVAEESELTNPKRYRLEYVKHSSSWKPLVSRGDLLPIDTVARECTAIGFTAKAHEEWLPGSEEFAVEMVGVSPYPNKLTPRVVGLITPAESKVNNVPPIRFVRGDALQPRGSGEKIVVHIVNDKTANWGAGFGRAVQTKWPVAQEHFKSEFERIRGSKLGLTALSRVAEDVFTFQMVCQRGYGPSPTPRLRYESLQRCLEQLRDIALQRNATVHMPKIGTGEAGGSWGLISNLIAEELASKGVSVTVYETPKKNLPRKKQVGLFDDSTQ